MDRPTPRVSVVDAGMVTDEARGMKILYLPLLAPEGASEQFDLADAFRQVADLRVLDYLNTGVDPNIALRQIFDEFAPDIVHAQYQGSNKIRPDLLAQLKKEKPGSWFTQWSGDVRPVPNEEMVEKGRIIDSTLLSAGGQCVMYDSAIGKRCCQYWQNAVGDRFLVEPIPVEERRGIVFCGHNYGIFPASEERLSMVVLLYKFRPDETIIHGANWPCPCSSLPWIAQPNAYRRARMTVGHNHLNDIRWYWSDRQLLCMAAGVPHLARYTPGMEDWFEDGVDCLFWRSIPELLSKVEWVENNPAEADAIGRQGQERVRREHVWSVRVEQYLEMYTEWKRSYG